MSGIHSDLVKQVTRLPAIDIPDDVLIAAFKRGDNEAGFQLFRKHYRMIIKIIREYTRGRWFSDDCLQAGAVGLYEAAKRFNPHAGTKFLTYAVWWIRKYVILEVCNDVLPAAGIGFSDSFKDKLFRFIGHKMTGLSQEQIMSKMRISRDEYADLDMAAYMTSMPGQIDAQRESDEDEDGGQHNVQEPSTDELQDDIVNQASFEELKEQVLQAIAEFPEQERFIIMQSLGVNGDEPLKPYQIARHLRISIPQVCELKREAFRKLRRILQEVLSEDGDQEQESET